MMCALTLSPKVERKRVSPASKKVSTGRLYLSRYWVGREVAVLEWRDYERMQRILRNLNDLKIIFEGLLNCKPKGKRMFNIVSRTWNPVTGCLHECTYCWARRLALTKLRNRERYAEGFKPRLNKEEFTVKFNEGEFIFVSDMGDLFGYFIPENWILKVLDYVRKFPRTFFLFLTKNPTRYLEFIDKMPSNAILGATIETNRDEEYLKFSLSRAPLPSERIKAMKNLPWSKKFISIEPILDFDLEVFVKDIEEVDPIMVYVGYDNYNNKLPEPPLKKTLELIQAISKGPIVVVRKTLRPAWYEGLSKYIEGNADGKAI